MFTTVLKLCFRWNTILWNDMCRTLRKIASRVQTGKASQLWWWSVSDCLSKQNEKVTSAIGNIWCLQETNKAKIFFVQENIKTNLKKKPNQNILKRVHNWKYLLKSFCTQRALLFAMNPFPGSLLLPDTLFFTQHGWALAEEELFNYSRGKESSFQTATSCG